MVVSGGRQFGVIADFSFPKKIGEIRVDRSRAFYEATLRNGIDGALLPVDVRLHFRQRFLAILLFLSDPGEPIFEHDLSDFAISLMEVHNEAFIYRDRNDVRKGFSSSGERVLQRMTEKIARYPLLTDRLTEVRNFVASYIPQNGREHGTGRAFWLELHRRVSAKVLAGERLEQSLVVAHANWSDVDASAAAGLREKLELRHLSTFQTVALGPYLHLEWGPSVFEGKIHVNLRLNDFLDPRRRDAALTGHTFVLWDESGKALGTLMTNEFGTLVVPIPKEGRRFLSFQSGRAPALPK